RRLAVVVDGELHQCGVSAVRTGDGAGELGLLASRGGADLLAGQGRVGPFGVARAPARRVDKVWWRVQFGQCALDRVAAQQQVPDRSAASAGDGEQGIAQLPAVEVGRYAQPWTGPMGQAAAEEA